MAEFTELLPLGKKVDVLVHMYQHIITFDIKTSVISCVIITLFFFIFYQILNGLFFWFLEIRPDDELHDLEEGTYLAYGAYGYGVSSSHHVTILQALIHANNMEEANWAMVATLEEEEEEEEDFDEKRGQKLRASNKLPPLVNYGMHNMKRACGDCAICLENFEAGQFCQVFPVCKHIFHSDCIDIWLQKKSTCPICRSSIM